jgi:transposase
LPDTPNGWYNNQQEEEEMGKRQRYDGEFKKEIAKLYIDGVRGAKSLASEIGVHENTIYKWAEEYNSDPENAFPGSGNQKPEAEELQRLKRELKELREENAILKKAAAYFAKNSR